MDVALNSLQTWWPLLLSLLVVNGSLWGMQRWLRTHEMRDSDAHLPRQLLVIIAYVLGTLVIMLSLPVSEATRGQLLSFIGLIITALIALSSTTLVANAMAGLLLRIVDSFRPGDFIRVGEHFGRVTERGLFHTEMQTEDRDLMTLPNMHLITNPVTVVFKSGTVISASLSLGYEIHHRRVEAELKRAAEQAGLTDPFVQILELGDFSVSYRIAGRLQDVGSILTARSDLRRQVLDGLHAADIEIVSPSFVAQRPQTPEQRMIPAAWRVAPVNAEAETRLEDVVFDKAEEASQKSERAQQVQELLAELKVLEADKTEAEGSRAQDLRLRLQTLQAAHEEESSGAPAS